ncbi:hypothetical protein E4U23_006200, partial [Claviceps purpurea]
QLVLRDDLIEAANKISILFDVWKPPAQTPILGIYTHFINVEGLRRQVLLWLKELHGRHTANNHALEVSAREDTD